MINVRALLMIVIGFLCIAAVYAFLRLAIGLSMSETFTGIFALSGWFAVIYGYFSDRSSVKANLLYVIGGSLSHPERAPVASYIAYIYLVNPGKNPVHLLDCELSVKVKGAGWIRLKRVYGKAGNTPVVFDSNPNAVVNISEEEIIFHKDKRLELGVPLYGWAPFVGDVELVGKEVVSYKLVSIDAYGRRHTVKKGAKELVSSFLAHELAGVRPPDA